MIRIKETIKNSKIGVPKVEKAKLIQIERSLGLRLRGMIALFPYDQLEQDLVLQRKDSNIAEESVSTLWISTAKTSE